MKCEMCRSTADQRRPLNTDFLLFKDKYVSFCLYWQTNYREIKAGVDISCVLLDLPLLMHGV